MTTPDLDAIQARVDAAQPGPWTLHGTSTLYMNGHAAFFLRRDGKPGQILTLSGFPADAEFIAHAREDVPALLAEVERLQAELAGARIAADERRHYLEAKWCCGVDDEEVS